MPDAPKIGGYKHKHKLTQILLLEDEAQDIIDTILEPIERGRLEITHEQLARIGRLRRLLQNIKQEAHEAREIIDNAPGEEKKIIQLHKRASGDGD